MKTNHRHFDHRWEKVYSESSGKHLNRYPFGELVSVFFRSLRDLRTEHKSAEQIRVLELGCGAGNNLPVPFNEGMATFGIDGSMSALEVAQSRFSEKARAPYLTLGDFCYLPFANDVFDIVLDRESVCSNVTEGIKRVFEEVSRVLRPGGLYISFMYSTDDGHYLRACNEVGHAERVESSTFSNFTGGTFAGTGNIHFFDTQEITDLCRGRLEILSLSVSKMERLLPESGNQRAEFILVARK